MLATQTISGTDRDSIIIEDENESSNIFSEIGEGFIGFCKDIGKVFFCLCYEPCKKGSMYRAAGFRKGFRTVIKIGY